VGNSLSYEQHGAENQAFSVVVVFKYLLLVRASNSARVVYSFCCGVVFLRFIPFLFSILVKIYFYEKRYSGTDTKNVRIK
tara:strand:- start:576 stop:815 length:240 start_codon:yes stop_codon:yes gene_type:complete